MLTPLKDQYLVSADEVANEKTKSGIIIDTTWDKYKHAVQVGIIESVPLTISKLYKDDVDIKVGDKAYFHHFCVQPDNYVTNGDVKYYKLPRYHLYCVIQKDKIAMLDEWLLASPILETEEDITKTFGSLKLWTKSSPDKVLLHATAEHISKECEKQGLKKGDTIIFRKDADYEMKIEGTTYYRMKMANVVAVIRDWQVIPLRNEILVQNNSLKEEIRASGLIIPILKPQREQKEMIINIGIQDEDKEFQIGQEIMYLNGTGSKVEHEGKKYVILRQEEVVGAFQC